MDAYLIGKGYVPYSPYQGVAHPFDRLCASADKKKILVYEVKAKPARSYYADTGINVSHYNTYRHIYSTYNIPVFLAFVDEDRAAVYGNFLHELEKPVTVKAKNGRLSKQYPSHEVSRDGTPMIYFPLSAMSRIADLTQEQVRALRDYSTRQESYAAVSALAGAN